MGIYSIRKSGKTSAKGRDRVGVGIRSSYIRVVGIQVDTEGAGEIPFTATYDAVWLVGLGWRICFALLPAAFSDARVWCLILDLTSTTILIPKKLGHYNLHKKMQ